MRTLPPAIVEVTRGPLVESRHEVDIVVANSEGTLLSVYGGADRPVFPRSSIKALQALALVESGAAERFGFEAKHIALACSSHDAEPFHIAAAGEMLSRAGVPVTCLECGAQLPHGKEDEYRLVREGRAPQPIHNTCSGKHSGFLAFAAHEGMETHGYVQFAHPVQRAIAGILEEVTGAPHREDNHAIDGCTIPTYAIPLSALARGFAILSASRAGPVRARAMRTILDACLDHPEMVAGSTRAATAVMRALGRQAMIKTGAEGMFVAALPEKGIGVALKVADGNERASEVAMAAMLESLLELSPDECKALDDMKNPPVLNRSGQRVGEIRPAAGHAWG
ncbi:MAG: asparaginase [Salaquimonas sp.]|jgi:L-asparaginase II|nr:asparaginase [Salaquimonas sp.]